MATLCRADGTYLRHQSTLRLGSKTVVGEQRLAHRQYTGAPGHAWERGTRKARSMWGAQQTRKPILSLRLSGLFLLRYVQRQLSRLLFHDPPRSTRGCAAGSPTGKPRYFLLLNISAFASSRSMPHSKVRCKKSRRASRAIRGPEQQRTSGQRRGDQRFK
jgi:hypothetical protein